MYRYIYKNFNDYDSLRTVIPIEKTPYKSYRINNGILQPLFEEVDGIHKPYDKCRQLLPETFAHSSYIDIMKLKVFLELNLFQVIKFFHL